MGTWPICEKKPLPTTDLNKKTFIWENISAWLFFPFFSICTCFTYWMPRHVCCCLAQASDIRIERRQVVFLCWMQDSNLEVSDTYSPADWMPTHKPTELSRIKAVIIILHIECRVMYTCWTIKQSHLQNLLCTVNSQLVSLKLSLYWKTK